MNRFKIILFFTCACVSGTVLCQNTLSFEIEDVIGINNIPYNGLLLTDTGNTNYDTVVVSNIGMRVHTFFIEEIDHYSVIYSLDFGDGLGTYLAYRKGDNENNIRIQTVLFDTRFLPEIFKSMGKFKYSFSNFELKSLTELSFDLNLSGVKTLSRVSYQIPIKEWTRMNGKSKRSTDFQQIILDSVIKSL